MYQVHNQLRAMGLEEKKLWEHDRLISLKGIEKAITGDH